DPFKDADWSASWKKTKVSESEWRTLRTELRAEATRWLDTLRTPREVQEIELNGMIGSIAHLAYHLGAIRQIDTSLRGPAEGSGGITTRCNASARASTARGSCGRSAPRSNRSNRER